MKRYGFLLVLFIGLSFSLTAYSNARPYHDHEDVFGESDLWFGPKMGPQVNIYTNVDEAGTRRRVPTGLGYLAGVSMQFVYELPRFEIGVQTGARGALNKSEFLYVVSFPILVKLPLQIGAHEDIFIGGGFQPEIALGGMPNFRTSLYGPLATFGFDFDLNAQMVMEFELRYVHGMKGISKILDGGVPSDVQILVGLYWHL